jgi:hypothetical protein
MKQVHLNTLLLHFYPISGLTLKSICKAFHSLCSSIVRRRQSWVGDWIGTWIICALSGNGTPILRSSSQYLSHYTGWNFPTPSSFPEVTKNKIEESFWTLNKRSANVQHVYLLVTNREYGLSNRKLSKTCSRAKTMDRRLVELAIMPNTQESIQELDLKKFTHPSNAWVSRET